MIYVCMYDMCILCMYVCVHAYFVGKMRSTNIILYSGLIFEEGNSHFTNSQSFAKNFPQNIYCWHLPTYRYVS